MERLDRRIASHSGTVKSVAHGTVEVMIESTSACATCQAHSRCGFAESKNKTLAIPTDQWQEYSVGDNVKVSIDESRGLLAVWIAYVLPAIFMIAVIAGLSIAHAPEWLVAVGALVVPGIYIGMLYLLRTKIGRRFTLTVEKC